MLVFIVKLILAYLIGSFPTAFIVVRLFKGVDIRKVGSGNVGATNVSRIAGILPGVLVLGIDILKGIFAAGYLSKLWGISTLGVREEIFLGLFAILGHNFPLFLKFQGGKGVATSLGVLLALDLKLLVLIFGVWVGVFLKFRYVSLASMVAAVSLPIFSSFFGKNLDFVLFAVILCLLIIARHRANIRRLFLRQEPRFK